MRCLQPRRLTIQDAWRALLHIYFAKTPGSECFLWGWCGWGGIEKAKWSTSSTAKRLDGRLWLQDITIDCLAFLPFLSLCGKITSLPSLLTHHRAWKKKKKVVIFHSLSIIFLCSAMAEFRIVIANQSKIATLNGTPPLPRRWRLSFYFAPRPFLTLTLNSVSGPVKFN